MKLTIAQMKYMLALGELDRGSKIRCTDVARKLQVRKPSVCGMLCRLERMGLIRQDPYSDVRLTEEGRKVMQEYGQWYQCIFRMLTEKLQLSDETASAVTCVLMGNLDSGTLKRLAEQT
jgi:DtxR family Mn-dependent transcriptional regulator